MNCPHCGKEFNAGKLMGSVKSERKAAASRKNGASMRAIIQAGKVALGVSSNGRTTGFEPVGVGSIPAAPANKREVFEMLKANLSGNRASMSSFSAHAIEPELSDTPHAPFDFKDEEGNPHRVRAYGKTLKVCFLRDGVEEPIRNLREGELEQLWGRRIK